MGFGGFGLCKIKRSVWVIQMQWANYPDAFPNFTAEVHKFINKNMPELSPLTAISPVDGRYRYKLQALHRCFSEFALIKYRIQIEVAYFMALCRLPLPQLSDWPQEANGQLQKIVDDFTPEEAEKVKAIEQRINHDVKAVEYYLKERFERLGYGGFAEFIHFGLTSQDINNTAIPLSMKNAVTEEYNPALTGLIIDLDERADEWEQIPMLARTHGQPASPTRLGKEIRVFSARLKVQQKQLLQIPFSAKFGGATGNFNAHRVAFPEVDWHVFANHFVNETLGLSRSFPTNQIEHYDNLAALLDAIKRINTILIDLCRDVWTYIAMEYFKQKIKKAEVGSSAMPHKVNPIDFENAEGNLGIANALLEHLAAKLPVSRLQRDLTDSTVTRNIGMPIAHSLLAFQSIGKGLGKLIVNEEQLNADLEKNWAVVAEAIQTVLRREGYPKPYEALKDLTRGNRVINRETIRSFIESLEVKAEVKEELLQITPFNYTGI